MKTRCQHGMDANISVFAAWCTWKILSWMSFFIFLFYLGHMFPAYLIQKSDLPHLFISMFQVCNHNSHDPEIPKSRQCPSITEQKYYPRATWEITLPPTFFHVQHTTHFHIKREFLGDNSFVLYIQEHGQNTALFSTHLPNIHYWNKVIPPSHFYLKCKFKLSRFSLYLHVWNVLIHLFRQYFLLGPSVW